MKFMEKVKLAAKAWVASRYMPIQWANYMAAFEAGAEWAQKQFALQLLNEMSKLKEKVTDGKSTVPVQLTKEADNGDLLRS